MFRLLFSSLAYGGLFVLMLSLGACQDKLKKENQRLTQIASEQSQEIDSLRRDNARLKEALGEELVVGFEVQIGAFKNFDLEQYRHAMNHFQQVDEDGLHKYVLARFANYQEADNFLKDIRLMGIEDAFIAGIVEGRRTTVNEARKKAQEYYGQ